MIAVYSWRFSFVFFLDEAAIVLQKFCSSTSQSRDLSTLSEHTIASSPSRTGVKVDKEGATYIPTLSIPAERPEVATTLFGPRLLTYDKFSLLQGCAWVSLVMLRFALLSS